MSPRSARPRAGLVAISLLLVTVATAVRPTTSTAQEPPDDGRIPPTLVPEEVLPDNDGAPPEDHQPTLYVEPGDTFTALAEPASDLPASPPDDNAFPIAGSSLGSCSNSFGDPRSDGRLHMGLDCFAPHGTTLVAVEDGVIRYATPGEPFSCATGGDISGNRVSLRGRSGYVYYYGHLDQILVGYDQQVQKGQIIGTIGATGNASCSRAHLHIEVKCGENGEPFDPYAVMGTWGRVNRPTPRWPRTEGQGVGLAFSGPNRQDLFALECGQAIRQKAWRPGVGIEPGWFGVGGAATSDPDAASPGPGGMADVFVRGLDNAAYHLRWTGSSWAARDLGGICTSGPAATYTGPARLDVFCRGTDDAIYQRAWTSSGGWAQWTRVGGIATSDPDVASPGPGWAPQVFVRGTDEAIYQLYWDAGRWVVVNLGGICSSGPSATYSGPERLDVFCRGTDLALYHRYWLRATGWSWNWTRIDSLLLSDPEATSPGPGGLPQVFVRGVDRRVYQFYWGGADWVRQIWGVT